MLHYPKFPRIILFQIICLLIFTLKSVYLLTQLSPGVPPDEMFQLQIIEIYRTAHSFDPFNYSWSTIPKPSIEFLRFHETLEYPYLYHLVFGVLLRILNLETFEFSTIVLLRALNLLIVIINLCLIFKILREARLSQGAIIVASIIGTHILMFTVLASAVSYDNFTNLFATAGLLYFLRFLASPTISCGANYLIFSLLGTLTKLSFLPLLACQGVVFIITIWRSAIFRTSLVSLFRQGFKIPRSFWTVVQSSIVVILTLFNIDLYGGNLYQYGKLLPRCGEIFSPQTCLQVKDYQVSLSANSTSGESSVLALISYFPTWIYDITDRMLGMWAMLGFVFPIERIIIVLALFFLALWKLVCQWNSLSPQIRTIIVITLGYGFYLFAFVNFDLGRGTVSPLLGVNGRYMFPVYIGLLVIIAEGWSRFVSSPLMPYILGLIALVFVTMEVHAIFFHPHMREILNPAGEPFYRTLAYYPNPVYDQHFNIVVK